MCFNNIYRCIIEIIHTREKRTTTDVLKPNETYDNNEIVYI